MCKKHGHGHVSTQFEHAGILFSKKHDHAHYQCTNIKGFFSFPFHMLWLILEECRIFGAKTSSSTLVSSSSKTFWIQASSKGFEKSFASNVNMSENKVTGAETEPKSPNLRENSPWWLLLLG